MMTMRTLLLVSSVLCLSCCMSSAVVVVFDDDTIRTAVLLWVNNVALATATYGPISTWDTSQVTNMDVLFATGPNFPADTFNDDISNWDTSAVTSMAGMFDEASAFNQDISGWNVSSVKSMFGMFARALAFNQSLSQWDTSSVEDMQSMFVGAANFTGDAISNWDTTSVKTTVFMFRGADKVTGEFLQDWDLRNVASMAFMFENTPSLSKNLCFSSAVNANVNVTGMFCNSNGGFAADCSTVTLEQRDESTRGCAAETPSPSPTTMAPSAATKLWNRHAVGWWTVGMATSMLFFFSAGMQQS